jgi:hypothetical protein
MKGDIEMKFPGNSEHQFEKNRSLIYGENNQYIPVDEPLSITMIILIILTVGGIFAGLIYLTLDTGMESGGLAPTKDVSLLS